MSLQSQVRARLLAGSCLLLLGLWILHGFLVPISWAVVLGITLWPFLEWVNTRIPRPHRSGILPALIVTGVISVLILGPVTFGLLKVIKEIQAIIQLLQQAHQEGLPPPEWLETLPVVGQQAMDLWNHWLGTSDAVKELIHQALSSQLPVYTRQLASLLLHRYVTVLFTLLVLFFVLLHGPTVGRAFLDLSKRTFGDEGVRYAQHALLAVRATVNGIILVALGQGILLGFGYEVVGFEHAALLGIVTGLIALIPFAAKIMSLGAMLVLLAQGHIVMAILFKLYALAVIIVADNYVKPKLIGNAVRLPFIWTLLGILGGVETLGLLGLFLGPTVMAILISIWRDSQDPKTAT